MAEAGDAAAYLYEPFSAFRSYQSTSSVPGQPQVSVRDNEKVDATRSVTPASNG